MVKLALIGRNISHSKSPQIYKGFLGDSLEYTLLDFESSSEIPTARDLLDIYEGISITAPYKDHFLSEVELAPEIRELGAVNCLFRDNESIHATNTDLLAMREIIGRELNPSDWQVVILGSGAMSRVTKLVLREQGIKYSQYSRSTTPTLSQLNLADKYSQKCYVINCCVREFKFTGKCPIGSHYWDLNYSRPNEEKSIKSLGLSYQDGEELLFLQAVHAMKMWKLKSSN